jgi:hypothetical protein
MQPAFKGGDVHVEPARVGGFFIKERSVALNDSVPGVLEREMAVRFVEWLVRFFRIHHFRVSPRLGRERRFFAVGKEKNDREE